MKKLKVSTHLFLGLLILPACSQRSEEAPPKAIPVDESAQNNDASLAGEKPKVLRALPVEEAEHQEIANAMVGRLHVGAEDTKGVSKKWTTGGRGFYNSSNRKRYNDFAEVNLTLARNETRTVYYPFGGPDVIYPLTFFPKTLNLVLVGVEPIGRLPTLEEAQGDTYQDSINDMMEMYLGSSFYRTQDMSAEAKSQPNSATWAKMMAAIALLDLKILSTATGSLTTDGKWSYDSNLPLAQRSPLSPKGVVFRCLRNVNSKSEFVSIYYFQQNLGEGNYGSLLALPKANPFRKFIASFNGKYTSFLKAASFLSHNTDSFKTSNDLVFGGDKIVQAPSGVPFSEFTKRRNSWKLSLFGEYREPSESFSDHNQEDLRTAYKDAISGDSSSDYADFVNYGGALPFHYDYGTGKDGKGSGSMMFYAIRGAKFPTTLVKKAIPVER